MSKRKKSNRELTSALGKGNQQMLNAELARAKDLMRRLDAGESISPADEAWLEQLTENGEAVQSAHNYITPTAHVKVNPTGSVKGIKRGGDWEPTSPGEKMIELQMTKRMVAAVDIVDEKNQPIVSEGPELKPLNGHLVGDALLALEMRNEFRLKGELSKEHATELDARGWNISVPMTPSDMSTMEAERKLRRYREGATLADELRDQGRHATLALMKNRTKTVEEALIAAHKFVLTNEAAEKVGQAINNYPEMLVQNGKFAIPPFPRTWIEMSYPAFYRGLGAPEDAMDDYSDDRVGYLFVDDRVYVASSGKDMKGMFIPIEYELHRPMSFEAEQSFSKDLHTSRAQIDRFMWGSAFFERMDLHDQRALRANHTVRPIRVQADIINNEAWQKLLFGAAGDLRNILGLLLMLNQPAKYLRTHDTKTKRSLSSKGPKVYMAHSTIELTMNRKPIRQLLTRNKEHGTHASPRWHEVRGHFCQDKTARESGCHHGGGDWWVEYEPKKWECLECGGKRWWREFPNGRGDASRGFVQSQHKVKA